MSSSLRVQKWDNSWIKLRANRLTDPKNIELKVNDVCLIYPHKLSSLVSLNNLTIKSSTYPLRGWLFTVIVYYITVLHIVVVYYYHRDTSLIITVIRLHYMLIFLFQCGSHPLIISSLFYFMLTSNSWYYILAFTVLSLQTSLCMQKETFFYFSFSSIFCFLSANKELTHKNIEHF